MMLKIYLPSKKFLCTLCVPKKEEEEEEKCHTRNNSHKSPTVKRRKRQKLPHFGKRTSVEGFSVFHLVKFEDKNVTRRVGDEF